MSNRSLYYKKAKTSKYKNKKVYVNGVKMADSKKESQRLHDLQMLEKAGKIKDLQSQFVFELQESFKHNGKTIRSIKYILDFYYFDIQKNKWILEDYKGFETDVFKIKRKMLLYKIQNNPEMELLITGNLKD